MDEFEQRQLKCRLKMIILTECFQESSRERCKTAMPMEKNLTAFLSCHFGFFWRGGGGGGGGEGVLLFSLKQKKVPFYLKFWDKSMFIFQFILTLTQ